MIKDATANHRERLLLAVPQFSTDSGSTTENNRQTPKSQILRTAVRDH